MKLNAICLECRSKHATGTVLSTNGQHTMQGNYSIKVPKLDVYSGTRNATFVENFLFGLGCYFNALGVRNDRAHISNAPTYLKVCGSIMVAP